MNIYLLFKLTLIVLLSNTLLACGGGSGGKANSSSSASSLNSSSANSLSSGGNPFITTWKTDNWGTSQDNQIRISTQGGGYNYSVDWGDGTFDNQVVEGATHTYAMPGIYTV